MSRDQLEEEALQFGNVVENVRMVSREALETWVAEQRGSAAALDASAHLSEAPKERCACPSCRRIRYALELRAAVTNVTCRMSHDEFGAYTALVEARRGGS